MSYYGCLLYIEHTFHEIYCLIPQELRTYNKLKAVIVFSFTFLYSSGRELASIKYIYFNLKKENGLENLPGLS